MSKIVVASPHDSESFQEFDCVLEAEVYFDVARNSMPDWKHLNMSVIDGDLCDDCPNRCNYAPTRH